MIISSWNIRGLNMPLKQNGILKYLKRNRVRWLVEVEVMENGPVVGHIKENCKKKQNNPTKAASKAVVSPTESTEQVPPEDEREKSLQGWILKQSKHSKAKTGVIAEGNGTGPSNALPSIPEILEIEDSPKSIPEQGPQYASETKRNFEVSKEEQGEMAKKKLRGWRVANNLSQHSNGRILIIWKEDVVHLEIEEETDQAIHCLATCKSSDTSFSISFIYAYNTIVGRRPLWENLRSPGVQSKGLQVGCNRVELLLIIGDKDEEIRTALFSIGEDKAPGLDGFSSCFFKRSWDIVGSDFTAVVKEFFSSGQILK
ncbi:hypothetical protein Acr_00g0055830 [Actinidia rufa]|uniref:Uncharacterized protein n=1 Tax=Actinidia rufa TaxID=165716 RepID=A0A7J0DP23_9ERIC|nr:hypothetical protein Acr_00g0055830 [Actinidia rufa]